MQDRSPALPGYGEVAHGRFDVNHVGLDYDGSGIDWIHANGLAYDAEHDQILVSAHGPGEIWVIDHSTTTLLAATSEGGLSGRGGDLLYRWGNASTYGRAPPTDAPLGGQHDAHAIPPGRPGAGNLLAFDNGFGEGRSRVVEWAPPRDVDGQYPVPNEGPFGPTGPVWTWEGSDDEPLFSAFVGSAQRQPGGNTLIAEGGPGRLLEVTPDGDVVWEYVNPDIVGGPLRQGETVPSYGPFSVVNSVFRAIRIPLDHPGLAGRDLRPRGPIERPLQPARR